MISLQAQQGLRNLHDPSRRFEIPVIRFEKCLTYSKRGTGISRSRDISTPGIENNGTNKRPSHPTSPETMPSSSSPRVALPRLEFPQPQNGRLNGFHDYVSWLGRNIYNAGTVLCLFLFSVLRSVNNHTNRLAKTLIGFIALVSIVLFISSTPFSFCQLAGRMSSSKPQPEPCQPFGDRSCWFEEPSLGSIFAQVNEKLVNIADIAQLERIPLATDLAEEKVSQLRFYLKKSSKDSSEELRSRLLDISSQATLTRIQSGLFAAGYQNTLMQAYRTTQSTIDRLRSISKAEANQAYLVRLAVCAFESIFHGIYDPMDDLKCSNNLSASQLTKHIDQIMPFIQARTEDASTLVQLFGNLRVHLKNAEEMQKRLQYKTMMEYYRAHESNESKDPDAHIWARLKTLLESKVWPRMMTLIKGKTSPTTALETLAPELYSLQLIIPFFERAEEYFEHVLSEFQEVEVELSQLRKMVEEPKDWTAVLCAFKKPPIRSWNRWLKSSFRIVTPYKPTPEGQRKIGMSSEHTEG